LAPHPPFVLQPICDLRSLVQRFSVLERKVGPPRLTREQRRDRLSRRIETVERNLQRHQRQERRDAKFDDWCTEINRRGETLLTASVPMPKLD
jgi:hypothetical protein